VNDCRAELAGGVLILENSRIRRQYAWNEGHLVGQQIVDVARGHTWELSGAAPDFGFPGLDSRPADGDLVVTPCPATALKPAHLQADVTTCLGPLQVRHSFRLYPGCPAIACDLYLRKSPGGSENAPGGLQPALVGDSRLQPGLPDLSQLELDRLNEAIIERLCIPLPHLALECVQFYDVTDRRNTLVARRSLVPYRHENRLPGNLLFVRDVLGDHALFVLKEASCSDVQLAWPGYDFGCRIGEIWVAGPGMESDDLGEVWTRCYGVVVGVAEGDEYSLLSALRAYQDRIRVRKSGRDHMILLNTWGDRGQDTRIGEAFALAELEQAARLGVTHFQLDDGWQAGRTSNSAYAGGSLEGIWESGRFWEPHPDRFPNGLGPVVERSRELGIELCLWFNPSADDSYAHWREDADVLIGLNRAYGIRTYKIDGVLIPDKRADRNLRAMFDRVMEATGGEASFNMDVTAGRRWGYHYGNEYGNIFLENRYTDWVNYYPHWTLRNLWMLARYVPPQNLQIEFLNKWRNADKYPASVPLADGTLADDLLAPVRVPFAYCFAITMMAQPLAWFEATGLPEEAFALAPTIAAYKEHQERIHAGRIFPIGEEPSGVSWTGFQSIRDASRAGYLAVYREWNDRPSARLQLWDLVGAEVRCRAIAGQGADFADKVGEDGCLAFQLPAPLTFALYEYHV
jgi:alpha-galactosidase